MKREHGERTPRERVQREGDGDAPWPLPPPASTATSQAAKSHSLERNLKGNAQRQLLPTPAQRHSPMLTTSQGQTPRMVYACACWRCPTRTEVM